MRRVSALQFVALPALPYTAAGVTQTLDAPTGGWNVSGLTDKSDLPAVNYSFSLIDRGALAHRTMIRGHLRRSSARRPFHTLVVNGYPTPLYSDNEGRFARGHAFGRGSNSVEIRGPDGKPLKRVQFYEASRSGPRPVLRVIAAWDDNQAEIDLHINTPDGRYAFFAQPALDNGGGLDPDTADAPDLENFTRTAARQGSYRVRLNFWGNRNRDGYHFDESTRQRPVITTRVTLLFNENTPRERREEYVVPLRALGELALVKSFTY